MIATVLLLVFSIIGFFCLLTLTLTVALCWIAAESDRAAARERAEQPTDEYSIGDWILLTDRERAL